MENRLYNGQRFYSEYLNVEPTKNSTIAIEEDYVDFYIFLDKAFRDKKILSFHVPFSFIQNQINSYQHSYNGFDAPLQEDLLHQELLECLIDDSKSMEDCYIMFIEYLCFGMRFRFSINKFTNMNFGVMATFDCEFNLKEKLIIEPEMNQSFHCQIIEK